MGLRELSGKHGGRQTPVNVSGRARTALQLIGTGDPLDLAGLQVGALCEGPEHERGVSVELREL
jgi:hypothetical protein